MSRPTSLLVASLCAALLCAPAPALAGDDAATAQALFDSALGLMKDGKYLEACPKLEESNRLDPAMGTRFRLAECLEQTGKLSRAWAHYVEVADAALRENNAKREKVARDRAEALKPRLPKLTIHVARAAAEAAGFELGRDGAAVGESQWSLALPVDPGTHTLTAKATGKQPWVKKIDLAEGAAVEVSVPALEEAPASAAGSSSASPGGGSPGWPSPELMRRAGAGALGVAAVAGVVVGSVFSATAARNWDLALPLCGGDPTRCGARGLELGRAAKSDATIATAAFVAAGGLLAGSVVVWLLVPSAKQPAAKAGLWLAPVVAPGSAGGVAGGHF